MTNRSDRNPGNPTAENLQIQTAFAKYHWGNHALMVHQANVPTIVKVISVLAGIHKPLKRNGFNYVQTI